MSRKACQSFSSLTICIYHIWCSHISYMKSYSDLSRSLRRITIDKLNCIVKECSLGLRCVLTPCSLPAFVCVGPIPNLQPALNAQRISSTLLCSFILSFRPAHTPLTHSLGGGQVLQRAVCRYKRTDPISHTAEQQLLPWNTHTSLLCRVMGNCLILLQQWYFIAVSLSHTLNRV